MTWPPRKKWRAPTKERAHKELKTLRGYLVLGQNTTSYAFPSPRRGKRYSRHAASKSTATKSRVRKRRSHVNTYNIKFVYADDGTEPQLRSYQAINAGQAFRKCLKEYPGAKLIEAWKEGGYLDGYGITAYKPPSVVNVQAEPAPKEKQLKFNFVPQL